MKLIKVLNNSEKAHYDRMICIIADIDLISEIGESINIPLSEYV